MSTTTTPARPPGTMETEPGSVSSFSATGTTATEPGGLAQTVNQPTTPDNPTESRRLASRNLQSSHPTPRFTYANVTASSTTPPSSPSTSPSTLKPTETTRHHRTQILRRLPYNTTTKHIISDVTRQLGYTEDTLFENVLRDPKDSRRFYLTYRTNELKQYATGKGFYVQNLHIKPTDNTTNGYIPFPPYYIDESTLQDLLKPYGTLVTGGFVKTSLNTRIAGYKFAIHLHKDKAPPTSIVYNNCQMDIKYDDDIRQCKYCGRYGHLIGKCRTKSADALRNQQHRSETRLTKWREETEALEKEETLERKRLVDNYHENLTAVSDVYHAALIAIEGTTEYEDRKTHLTEIFTDEQEEMANQLEDTINYIAEEFAERKTGLDEQFVRSGGIIPPSSEMSDEELPMAEESDETYLESAEHRFTTKLQQVVRDTVAADPTPPLAEESPTSIDKQQQQSNSEQLNEPSQSQPQPTHTTRTPYRSSQQPRKKSKPTKPKSKLTKSPVTPFHTLPPIEQEKQIKEAQARLGPDYDFKAKSRLLIQFRTETTHITQIIRSHLFHTKSLPGYQYINPLETVVCTSDQDESSRIVYTKDQESTDHLLLFLQQCREQNVIRFLDDPTCRPNPSYDPASDWT